MRTGMLIVLMSVLAMPLGARAQEVAPSGGDVTEAERLFDEGVAATERGDFAAALDSFQRSHRLNPLPDVLYNIAMCHKALGDLPAALNAFAEYVARMGGNLQPDEQAEFDALLADLVPRVGRIVVESTQTEAEIRIDRTAVGSTPMPGWRAVAPGRHRVEITKPGFGPYSTQVDVRAGQTLTVTAPLVAIAGPPPVGPRVGTGPVAPVGPEPTDGEGLSPWFWTCVGIAGASALTMAITGGLTLKYRDDFDAGGRTDAELRDTALALRTTTDVFLGIGLAAVIAGTVLFFVEPGEEEADLRASGEVSFAVFPVGIGMEW